MTGRRLVRSFALFGFSLVGAMAPGLVGSTVAFAAVGPNWAQIKSISSTDVTAISAVLRVEFDRVNGQGPGCIVHVWANVGASRQSGRGTTETSHTMITANGNQTISFRVDNLEPNSLYFYAATVRITGRGPESAPCRDVSEHTTDVQQFTTQRDPASQLSIADVTVHQGVTTFKVIARPSHYGTTRVSLEYGPTTGYGSVIPPLECRPNECTTSFSIQPDPTVLKPHETYHARALLDNQLSGHQVSADRAFTAPNVCTLPPKAGANFTGCVLNGVDWSTKSNEYPKPDWKRIVLNDAKMITADLRVRHMTQAQMIDTKLIDAKMQSMNLDGANLQGANLSGADLSGAVLTGANLAGADLNGTELNGANLTRATLPASISEAKCGNSTYWPNGFQDHGERCPPPSP